MFPFVGCRKVLLIVHGDPSFDVIENAGNAPELKERIIVRHNKRRSSLTGTTTVVVWAMYEVWQIVSNGSAMK